VERAVNGFHLAQKLLAPRLALLACALQAGVPQYVEREFRHYLECGILAHGFARARCGEGGHDFLMAFSCKGRGVCPSCNARRMVEAAAHLVDQVLPPLPVRQWVLSVPKRLRYFLQRDPEGLGAVLYILLRVIEARLRERPAGRGELRAALWQRLERPCPLPLLRDRRGVRGGRGRAGPLCRGRCADTGRYRRGAAAGAHSCIALVDRQSLFRTAGSPIERIVNSL
jgi:hypothetical protein